MSLRKVASEQERQTIVQRAIGKAIRAHIERIEEKLDKIAEEREHPRRRPSPETFLGVGGGLRLIERYVHYNAGLHAGRDDQAAGRSFDLNRHAEYKDGTCGYNSSWGSKGLYQRWYRAAWMRGYEVGYGRRRASRSAELDTFLRHPV